MLKKIDNRFILYFHNDPLSMKGSKKISERLNILKFVEKVVFVSEWVRERFFIDIDKKLITKTEVIYPSVDLQRACKKEKIITFVGRLNYSKGYDIFSKSIVKILDEFPNWKALSIGDEDRRTIYIKHNRHKELGFLNHKKTLNILNKSEIAVVPSRWDEPFGRTSLEASSRGCATIISNKGGLIETTDNALILNKLDELNLYQKLKKLIKNSKFRKNLQNLGRNKCKTSIQKIQKLLIN
jgi:glycosyltransferase involved in cell wall biosynthesis